MAVRHAYKFGLDPSTTIPDLVGDAPATRGTEVTLGITDGVSTLNVPRTPSPYVVSNSKTINVPSTAFGTSFFARVRFKIGPLLYDNNGNITGYAFCSYHNGAAPNYGFDLLWSSSNAARFSAGIYRYQDGYVQAISTVTARINTWYSIVFGVLDSRPYISVNDEALVAGTSQLTLEHVKANLVTGGGYPSALSISTLEEYFDELVIGDEMNDVLEPTLRGMSLLSMSSVMPASLCRGFA